jgi:hypothetical protein
MQHRRLCGANKRLADQAKEPWNGRKKGNTMVYLPVSQVSVEGASRRSRFAALADWSAALVRTLGAAIRVSQAVESHRDADPGDLKILGIPGPLPRVR